MSIEQLLFLGLMLLLPAIQRLVEALRARQAAIELPPPGTAPPVPARVPPPATPPLVLPASIPVPLPARADPPAVPISQQRRDQAQAAARNVRAAARPDRTQARRRDVPARTRDTLRVRERLGTPDGLRQAFALMTILGPCRALEPDLPGPIT